MPTTPHSNSPLTLS